MSKRHTNLNSKQNKGQFFTKNATNLLSGYESLIKDKKVIDPFAGDCDLLDWAETNGALSVVGYDIEPRRETIQQRDTLLDVPVFKELFLLTNPPYLCSNKNKDKRVYEKWFHNDLYKCHMASFIDQDIEEGIIILPSNFISEGRAKIRTDFFRKYTLTRSDYYYYSVFPDATTGIVVFHFRKADFSKKRCFTMRIHYSEKDIQEVKVELEEKYDWLWGKDFFDYINFHSTMKIEKWTGKEKGYLTNIVIGLLDKGKWKQGLSYNEGPPIICGEKAFTTYQVILDRPITNEKQKEIVVEANKLMDYYRTKYHGLFLSNYMGATQKIWSRKFIHKIIEKLLLDRKELKNE